MMFEFHRQQLLQAHSLLVYYKLVVWTQGNCSLRIPNTNIILIKPSGVSYSDLAAEHFVAIDLNGMVIDGTLKPSTDTDAHLYLYNNLHGDIGGIVHTHSPCATAFAAVGKSIPCALTAQADEFGGFIPCSDYARIGTDEIGKQVVETLKTFHAKSSAVLLKNHGVITFGKDVMAAVKSAVMVEDCARTTQLALSLGVPQLLMPEQIQSCYERYHESYGQK